MIFNMKIGNFANKKTDSENKKRLFSLFPMQIFKNRKYIENNMTILELIKSKNRK